MISGQQRSKCKNFVNTMDEPFMKYIVFLLGGQRFFEAEPVETALHVKFDSRCPHMIRPGSCYGTYITTP